MNERNQAAELRKRLRAYKIFDRLSREKSINQILSENFIKKDSLVPVEMTESAQLRVGGTAPQSRISGTQGRKVA